MKLPFKLVGGVLAILVLLTLVFVFSGCDAPGGIVLDSDESEETEITSSNDASGSDAKIIFLHHSTGEVIWSGGVPEWFDEYNAENDTDYQIAAQDFPKDSPYGWENYPYDYWNIWVNHAGNKPYKQEPTLEILADEYDVVAFKHCFPVSDIEESYGEADVTSSEKTEENYKLQYNALKEKMHEFPDTDFIVWTGAAQVKGATDADYARRAQGFFNWVVNDWDEAGDNIYIWDFYALETEGGMYLLDKYASDPYDSHPSEKFGQKVAPLFGQKVVDVVEGRGNN